MSYLRKRSYDVDLSPNKRSRRWETQSNYSMAGSYGPYSLSVGYSTASAPSSTGSLNSDTSTTVTTIKLRKSFNAANQSVSLFKKPLIMLWRDKRSDLYKMAAPMHRHITVQEETSIDSTSGLQALASYVLGGASELQLLVTAMRAANVNETPSSGARGFMPNLQTIADAVTATETVIRNDGTENNTTQNLDNTTSFTRVKVPQLQKEYTFRNPTNFPCYLFMYEYVCRQNCDITPNDAWADSYQASNDADRGTHETVFQDNWSNGATVVTTVSSTYPGQRPCGRTLRKYWKQLAYAKCFIKPGSTIKYTLTCSRKSISQMEITRAATNYIAGWSKNLLVILAGVECSSANAAQEDVISTTDATLNVKSTRAVACMIHQTAWPYYSMGTFVGTATNPMYEIVATADQRITNPQNEDAEGPIVDDQ